MSPGKSFQIVFINFICWGSSHLSVHCTLASTIGSQFVLGLFVVTLLPISLNTRRNILILSCFVTGFLVSCGIFPSSPRHKSFLRSWSFLHRHIKNLSLDHREAGKASYAWQNFTECGSNAKFTMKTPRREASHWFLALHQHTTKQVFSSALQFIGRQVSNRFHAGLHSHGTHLLLQAREVIFWAWGKVCDSNWSGRMAAVCLSKSVKHATALSRICTTAA